MESTISDVIEAFAERLAQLYPNATIYQDKTHQEFETPSFYISIAELQYRKDLHNRYVAELLVDIAYFTDRHDEVMTDCALVAENLLRNLEVIGTDAKFRVTGKQSRVTDDVLHIMSDVIYREIDPTEAALLQDMGLVTNLKEE